MSAYLYDEGVQEFLTIAHPLNQINEMEFSTSVHSTMVFLHIIVTKDWIKAKKEPFVSNSIPN